MNQDETYQLFRRVYDMTGHGLSDYLGDFFDDPQIRATRHGESVFYRYDYRNTPTIFSRWDLWRQEVTHYFDDFLAEWEHKYEDINEEEFLNVFVFKIARILGTFNDIPNEPVNVPAKEQEFDFW